MFRRLHALLSLAVVVPLLVAAAGCGGGVDEESIEKRLESKGTMDVIEEATAAEYDPPEDGRLSEEQMEMYVAVQERAARIRRVAQKRMQEHAGDGEEERGIFDALRAVGDVGDVVTAELRAAQELGHNPAEFNWVKAQVVEARMAELGRRVGEGMAQAGEGLLESLRRQRDAAGSEERREELDRQIEEYERSLEEARQGGELSPALQHNVELVERYQERLDAIEERAAEDAEGS